MDAMIRKAVDNDAAELAQLAAATFPLACPPHSPAPDIAEFIAGKLNVGCFSAYLANPTHTLFVAEAGVRLLGYTMVVHAPPSDTDVARIVRGPDSVELSKCYALPETHGTGIAARLMAASLGWGAAQGASLLWLGVNCENIRAIRFYTKQGFEIAGPRTFQLGTRLEHDFVMTRPVRSTEQ